MDFHPPKLSLLLLVILLFADRAVAQEPTEYYYPYADRYADLREERADHLLPDSTIFYRAIRSSGDLYSYITDYRVGFVASKRRGLDWNYQGSWVEGLDLPYRYFSALRSLGAQSQNHGGLSVSTAHIGGLSEFRFLEQTPLPSLRASTHFTDRNYRFGAKFSATEQLGHGWWGSLSLDGRTGRDLHIDGVFTNSLTSSLRLSKRWSIGHSLDIITIIPASARGIRSSSLAEAFELTGNRLYNPSWGLHAGKIRNSRVRREFLPLILANGLFQIASSTDLRVAVSGEYGTRRYSSLGWYDARTPAPDNYRSMPSFSGDQAALDGWRSGDQRYTQINWDELIRQNRLADSEAIYSLNQSVDRHFTMRLSAIFTTQFSPSLRLSYGLRGEREDIRSYKQISDLLGAKYLTDIDHYLVDDDTYGNQLQNDLRHPNRRIEVGGRFGYDYSLVDQQLTALVLADFSSDRLVVQLAAELCESRAMRRGHFEKELFAGALSYGPSGRIRFMPYSLRAMVGYSFSARNYLSFNFTANSESPSTSDLFYQPQYNNLTLSNPRPQKSYAAQLDFRHQSRTLSLQFSGFIIANLDGLSSNRYFDDMSGQFANLSIESISQLSFGIEASAQIRLADRWNLSLATSAGRYTYLRNPTLTVLSDADNSTIDHRSHSAMKGLFVGGAPQITSCAEISYYASRGWSFRASANYSGFRYVEPSPLRRTSRISEQGGSTPELHLAFMYQERLPDAFRIEASVFKSFNFGVHRLTAGLMVRNLLGDRNTIYDGYESLRVMRRLVEGSELYSPQPTRYSYSYPRSFYITISYKF